MKHLALIIALFSPLAFAAEEQISSSRLTALNCQAWNALGTSQFTLNGRSVDSLTNGIFPKSYSLSNIGNSGQFGFGFVNMSAGREVVSLAFPAQELRAGELRLNGVLFLNAVVNPFQPMVGMGTPWAQVSCSLRIGAR